MCKLLLVEVFFHKANDYLNVLIVRGKVLEWGHSQIEGASDKAESGLAFGNVPHPWALDEVLRDSCLNEEGST
jgi:hypothetical protein